MSVKKLNFLHMTRLHFPSAASRATRDWSDYTDQAEVPSLVLMENMERDGAEVVFVAFKDISTVVARSAGPFFTNSRVALVTMNTGSHAPMLPEAVKVTFARLIGQSSANVSGDGDRCVHWSETDHAWNDGGCRLLRSNSTHVTCGCVHFGMMALESRWVEDGAVAEGQSAAHVTVVVAVVAAAVVIFCVVVGFAVGMERCRKIKRVSKRYQSELRI